MFLKNNWTWFNIIKLFFMVADSSSIVSISECIPEIWDLLSTKERELVSANAKILDYKKNEVIYQEEEMPLELMCLCKGKVKIYKDGVGGRSQIIRMIRPTNTLVIGLFLQISLM